QRDGVFLGEGFSESEINRGVARKIIAGILHARQAVGESRTVIHIGGDIGLPGQSCIEAQVQCVSLIVIDGGESGGNVESTGRGYGNWADQAAGNWRRGLCDLIRISKVKLAAMPEIGRAKSEFPALNHRVLPGDGPKEIGVSDVVVVEPVLGAGFIIIGAEVPAVKRNGDAELPFDIALPLQRRESKILAVGQIEQRAGCGDERRGLIEVSVKSAKDPIQSR